MRAYIAAQALENLEETMQALEKAEGKNNLTQFYLDLSRQLDKSLKVLREKDNPEQVANVARGLTSLLSHLANRPAEETNFEALKWVAKNFEDLGKNIEGDNKRLPPEAAEYYRKAAKTYGAIVKACKADEKFAPNSDSICIAQMQMAYCLRRVGEFGQALTVLTDLLRERNGRIDAQREAALTYQGLGRTEAGRVSVCHPRR